MANLESLFRTNVASRDNFLSRIFGIFSEEVVRFWCANPAAAFTDLGRPTLHTPEGKWHTLDFTLRDTVNGQTYVAELKCELAYDQYRYLRLTDHQQLDHHRGAAFIRFLEMARPDHGLITKVGAKPVAIDGAILIWGATTPDGVAAVKESLGVADVLSIEEMVNDLHRWEDDAWMTRVHQLKSWSNELFDHLAPGSRTDYQTDSSSSRCIPSGSRRICRSSACSALTSTMGGFPVEGSCPTLSMAWCPREGEGVLVVRDCGTISGRLVVRIRKIGLPVTLLALTHGTSVTSHRRLHRPHRTTNVRRGLTGRTAAAN